MVAVPKVLRHMGYALFSVALVLASARTHAVSVEPRFEPSTSANGLASAPFGVLHLRLHQSGADYDPGTSRPMGWLIPNEAGSSTCSEHYLRLSRGGLRAGSDVDLNLYRVLVLNSDRSIGFLNPFLRGPRGTRLESSISVPGEPADWAFVGAMRILAVSQPERDAIALIDTVSRTRLEDMVLPAGSRPTRLLAAEEPGRIWVSLDGHRQVALLDLVSRTLIEQSSVGAAPISMALVPEHNALVVVSGADHRVSLLDSLTGRVRVSAPIPGGPTQVRWSPLARRMVVSSYQSGALSMVDPARLERVSTLSLKPGIADLRLSESGRFAYVLNHLSHELAVIDLARNRLLGTGAVEPGAHELALSRDFVYARNAAASGLTLFPRAELERGVFSPKQLPVDELARTPAAVAPAGLMATLAMAPSGKGMLIASGRDRAIYQYAEGSNVQGSKISNNGRVARALMVPETGLQEVKPGHYTVAVDFPAGGRYDVVMRIPRQSEPLCATVQIPGPTREQLAQRTRTVLASLAFARRESGLGMIEIGVQLRSTLDRQLVHGVRDAQLMVFNPTRAAQRRVMLHETEAGLYTARLADAQDGRWDVLLDIASQGLPFHEGWVARLQIDGERVQVEPKSPP